MPGLGRLYNAFTYIFTSRSILSGKIKEMEEEKKIIEGQYDEVNKLNAELIKTMKHLLAVQDMANAILSVLNLEELLPTIMNILSGFCRTGHIIIMLKNDTEEYLEFAYGTGFSRDIPDHIEKFRVSLHDRGNILARAAFTGDPECVSEMNISALGGEGSATYPGDNVSLYIVPLITRSKVIGLLLTDIDGNDVTEEMRETQRIFAPQIAIAIENARLYMTLQEQLRELEKSHSMLRRADRFAFLSNISERLANDIKEPITTIGKFIRLLPDNFDDEKFRNGFYDMALDAANRVNNLISELLNLVRPKEAQFEMVDLHDLIEKTILMISPNYKAKKIAILRHYDPEINHVWIDPEKMKQALLNVISNAVYFTPTHGKIEIFTSAYSENGSKGAIIRIKDNGIGIQEGALDKIFDPYFSTRVDDGETGNGGLGLFVALQNIQDNKGSIEVESRWGEGTIFIIRIPLDSH